MNETIEQYLEREMRETYARIKQECGDRFIRWNDPIYWKRVIMFRMDALIEKGTMRSMPPVGVRIKDGKITFNFGKFPGRYAEYKYSIWPRTSQPTFTIGD